jgi:hypothetical protein
MVKVIPQMNAWRTELKKQERAKRLAFEMDKAHHFALKEYEATRGVGFKKFEAQRKAAAAESRKKQAEKNAQRVLFLESKRLHFAELRRRELVKWAFRKGPRMEVKPGTFLPVVSVLRIYAEVAEGPSVEAQLALNSLLSAGL